MIKVLKDEKRETMLSKTSIVICGLLLRETLSAYDIIKKIEEYQMRYWLPIGNTTVYETALRLEKKGVIKGGSDQANKVVYTLTESGLKILKKDLAELFLKVDYDTIWFSLALLFSEVFQREELIQLIKKRKAILEGYREGTVKQIEAMKKKGIPYQGVCTIERMLEVTALEEKTLIRLEEEISMK